MLIGCLSRVKPVNYDISIYDLELGGAFSYQGAVTIEMEIRKPTKEIVLNAHQLKIHSAIVSVGEKQGNAACSSPVVSISRTLTTECSNSI